MDHFTLALKYYASGLTDAAWQVAGPLAADADAPSEVLGLAAALRLDVRAHGEAAALAERMIARDPNHLTAWLLKAQALLSGKAPGGREAFEKALSLQGRHPPGWNNVGLVLDALGHTEAARAAYQRAIAELPSFSLAHNNLGASFAGQGAYAKATACYRKALEHDPGNLGALNNLGVALLEQGLIDEARAVFEDVLAQDPENAAAADNRLYALIYTQQDPRAVRAAHVAWGRRHPAPAPLRLERPGADRRLRIGYVSPDFRHHSVSFFTGPLLATHDPAVVEVFCYADVAVQDAVTGKLRQHMHHWRNVTGRSDVEVCDLIRADGIDILVDLAGHTKGNRLGVFARRAAPVQVTALGYPATTGLPAMDARLVDVFTDPAPEAESWSSETLVRLPALHCYQPPTAPDVGELPVLKAGHITFGSFNKLAKISPATVALWAGVLRALTSSRLVIKNRPLVEPETRARLAAQFAAHGIAADRLDLQGWRADDRDHLNLYNSIDIALDTSPYNGTTTTCEALWMGVPVLTLADGGHAGMVGASLLNHAGLQDWIAGTARDFVTRAVDLAEDHEGLARLRAGLRARVTKSRLCDAPAYARSVEAAYRALWGRAASFAAQQ